MSASRRALTAFTLAIGLALTPAAVANASLRGICPKPYPNPRISLNATDTTVQVGTTVWFAGHLSRNGCPLPGQKVGFFAREQAGPFTYVGESMTDSLGGFNFGRNAPRSYEIMAIFSKTALYARTESRTFHVTVTKDKPPQVIVLAGCHLPLTTPLGLRPPTGVRADLELDGNGKVKRGSTLTGHVRITNYLPGNLLIDEITGARAAILRSIKTGELATPTYFTNVVNIVHRTILPRRSISLPISVKTVTCEDPVLGPPIHAGSYDVIASVELTVGGVRTTWVPPVKQVKVTA